MSAVLEERAHKNLNSNLGLCRLILMAWYHINSFPKVKAMDITSSSMKRPTMVKSPESDSAALIYLVNLNNDAVALLLAKSYAAATSRMTRAIALLKTLADVTPKDAVASARGVFQFDLVECSHDDGQDLDLNEAGSMFVCQYPIRIRHEHTNPSSCSITDPMLNQISFAVVYNLALAWHVGAVESADSSELQLLQAKLCKAQGFSKMATNLIGLMPTVAGSLHNRSMARVAPLAGLAIVNNQASIHHMLGHAEEAKASQSLLMSHLMFVSSRYNLYEKKLSPRTNYYLQRLLATALLRSSGLAAAA
jgi:hypothetical protein